jgi:TolA-binding protein
MSRKTTDESAEVEHQIAKAHEARESAQAEYRSYLQAEDMAAVRGARDAIRRHDSELEVLNDRLEILRQRESDEAQRQADQRLKQATKRAEAAAEKERQAAAEVDAVREQMAVLLDKLKATSDEAFRASAAMIQAADAAGTDAPRVRTAMTREADPNRLTALAKHIAGLFNQQMQGATEQSSRRRRAG